MKNLLGRIIYVLILVFITLASFTSFGFSGLIVPIIFHLLWKKYPQLESISGAKHYRVKSFVKWLAFGLVKALFSICVVILTYMFIESPVTYCGPAPESFSFPHFILIFFSLLFVVGTILAVKYKKYISQIFKVYLVISIIMILGSTASATINGSTSSKGCESVIKASLAGMRSQAEIFRESNDDYGSTAFGVNGCYTGTMFTSDTFKQIFAGVRRYENVEIICNSNGSSFAVGANLPVTGGWWCIDSTQAIGKISQPLEELTKCP